MKRRFLVLVSALAILSLFAAFSLSAEFWDSRDSDKYHTPSCRWAQKISPANLVKFKSPEDVRQSGI